MRALTQKEALAMLGVPKSTFYHWVRSGWYTPPPGRGRQQMWTMAEIERLRAFLSSPRAKVFASRNVRPPDKGVHPLVNQLFELLQGHNLKQVIRRAGYNRTTLTAMRRGHSPRLTTFEDFLNVLGYELCIRKREK